MASTRINISKKRAQWGAAVAGNKTGAQQTESMSDIKRDCTGGGRL
jgi:hypothetical protein